MIEEYFPVAIGDTSLPAKRFTTNISDWLEIRCKNCNKLLLKIRGCGRIRVKCTRCGAKEEEIEI